METHLFMPKIGLNYRSGGKEVGKRKEKGRKEVKKKRKQRKEESIHLQFFESNQ